MSATMEQVMLHPAMSVLLNGLNLVGSLSPIPGPAAVGMALQAVQDAVEKAKWRREECHRLSEKCQALADSFYEDMQRIDNSGLLPAVNEIIQVLEDVQSKITEFGTWGRMKAIWRDDDIRTALEKSEEDVQSAINKYKLTSGNKTVGLLQELKSHAQQSDDRNIVLEQVIRICHLTPDALKSLPEEDVLSLLNGSADVLHKMQKSMYKDDAELEVEGVRVDRTQFNAVYKQILDCLNQIQRETGVQLEVRNLGRDVVKDPEASAVDGGDLTELYKGYYLQDKVVAIKCLRGLRNASEQTKARVLNQCKVWSHFKHPRVHTFMGITDNYYYLSLVSDYYKNSNIMRYTKNNRKVNKYHLLAGTVEGLLYLYEKHKVCHGNLKGHNVLINDEGEPLVADFQMSQLLTGLAKDLHLETATLTRQPSPRWKAPELMNGNAQPTPQSDIWSVGMLMLEVLTGFVPFHLYARNEQVMFQVSTHGLRPKRPENNKQIPDQAWELMEACWRTPPDERLPMREVYKQLIELDAWWEKEKPTPEQDSFRSMRRYIGYYD